MGRQLRCLIVLIISARCLSSNITNEDNITGKETWESLEKFLRQIIDRFIKEVLPVAVRLQSEVNISSACSASLMQFVLGLKQMKLWTLQMLDASGKPMPGIMQGSITIIGSYRQCLDIEVNERRKLRGQYCTIDLQPVLPPKPPYIPISNYKNLLNQPSKMSLATRLSSLNTIFYVMKAKFGVCIPSTCNENDLQEIVTAVIQSNNIRLNSSVASCEVQKDFHLSNGQIIVICIFTFMLLLAIFGTVVDMKCNKLTQHDILPAKRNKLKELVLVFSMNKSFKKLLGKSTNPDLSALYGIHFLSVAWIIVSFTYKTYHPQYMQEVFAYKETSEELSFRTVLGSSNAFNTLFFLSGLITAYVAVKNNTEKQFSCIKFIVQRYLRLTLLVLIAISFIVLVPLLGSGPFWKNIVESNVEACKNSWWTYVLYFSNWMKYENGCTLAFQYTSVLFQIHIVVLFVLIFLFRYLRLGILIAFVLMLSSVGCIAYFTYTYEIHPTITKFYEDEYQSLTMEKLSLQPYTHWSPYCIGILTGFLIAKHKNNFKMKKIYEIIAWTFSIFGSLMIIYYPHYSYRRNEPIVLESIITSSVHRTIWSLAIAWTAFACITNRADAINKFLSMKIFVLLSRLSHLGFFLIEFIIRIRYGMMQLPFYYSHFNMVYEIFGHFLLFISSSFLTYILIEAPITTLQQRVFSSFSKQTADQNKIQDQKIQLKAVLTRSRF